MAEKRLTAETIEGDVVWLENTTAKVVRGKNVTVGPGCVVDLVEYAESYTPAGAPQVREARQVSAVAQGRAGSVRAAKAGGSALRSVRLRAPHRLAAGLCGPHAHSDVSAARRSLPGRDSLVALPLLGLVVR